MPRAQTGSKLIRFICKLKPPKTQCFRGFGVPGAIRTRGVPLRRRALYPAEVRGHMQFLCAPLELPKEFLGGGRSILLSYGEGCGRRDRESDYTRFERFVNRSKELAGLGIDVAAAHGDDQVAGGRMLIQPGAEIGRAHV